MRGYVKTTELAEIMDCSRQWVYKQEQVYNWKTVVKNGTKYYNLNSLPVEVRDKVRAHRRGIVTVKQNEINNTLPEWKRKQAADRFRLLTLLDDEFKKEENINIPKIDVIEKFILKYNAGEVSASLLHRVGPKSSRTLQRWMKQYNESPNKNPINALTPAYGIRKGQTNLSQMDREYVTNMFLRPKVTRAGKSFDIGQNQLSVMFVYKQYLERCRAMIAEGREVQMVSYDTVRRYVKNISLAERIYYREGKKAYHDKIEIHAKRDYETIVVNEMWTSDGHDMNILVVEDREHTDKFRPCLVVILDMRTRKIMGFNIQRTESSQSVVDAMTDAIYTNDFVVPHKFYIDNGKAFKNKFTMGVTRDKMKSGHRVPQKIAGDDLTDTEIQGVYAELGIRTSFALPYNSAAKGTVEKMWDNVDCNFSKQFPTYVGKDNQQKPEILKAHLKDPDAIVTIDELREMFKNWVINTYNQTPHRGHGMNNRTPDQVYASATDLRTVSESQVVMASMRKEKRVVRRDGVQWNNWFYSDKNTDYAMYIGDTVYIAINPKNVKEIYVLDINKNFLFKALQNQAVNLNATDLETSTQIIERKRKHRVIKKLVNKTTDMMNVIRIEDTTYNAEKFVERQALNAVIPEPDEKALISLLGE